MAHSDEAVSYREDNDVKHALTEELFDLHVNRRIAAWIVQALMPTPVSANHITLTGAALACFSGYLLAVGTAYSLGWAAVCLMSAMVLDCADGQLARNRGGGSRLGRTLDGMSDYINATALHLGMWAYLASTGVLFRERIVDGWGLFAWVSLAGVSMALHSGMFDFRKQWFLAHTTEGKGEFEDPDLLRQEIAACPSAIQRGAMRFYLIYASVQSKLTGGCEVAYIRDATERRDFVEQSRRYMRALNLIGPTHHNVLILLAMVAAPFYPESFWWYVLTVTVPMNLAYVALVFWGRRVDGQLKQG